MSWTDWTEETPLGKCRRRVLIAATDTTARADVEDDAHRFGVDLTHDGAAVLSASSRSIRFPYTTCAAADGMIEALAGAAITTDTTALARFGPANLNCTHRFDLAAWAIAQAARGPGVRQYDVATGPEDGRMLAVLERDGRELLRWSLEGTLIHAEGQTGGQDIRHILKWARTTGDDDLVEAISVMRRGILVSQYRQFDPKKIIPASGVMASMAGACFAFQPGIADEGDATPGNFRNFDAHPERLLRDLQS